MRNIIFILAILFFWSCTGKKAEYIYNEGVIYGTVYHITYESPTGNDFHDAIKQELSRLDFSFSTFNPQSVISKVNKNEPVVLDSLFINVFNCSRYVWEKSSGAFDPTVMPLVNVWGFGFKNKENVTPEMIDSILTFVGMEKIKINGDQIVKSDPRTMLDFSAIAKGYTVDLIGQLLAKMGCKNYMVEIGGEVITCGKNPKGKQWRIGINKPNDDEPMGSAEFQAILSISNKAIATSGNYRNFYVQDGKKYAHTIDPATGCPVQHNLLSTTVIANDCMTADGFATAFMVLGTEKAMALANSLKGIEVFLIYSDKDGQRKTVSTNGFQKYIAKN